MSALLEPSQTVQTLQTTLNYTRNTGVRPVNYTFDPPSGMARNSGVVDARAVTLHNARQARGLNVDVSGFQLIEHHSSLGSWQTFQNRELVEAIDYPEVIAAIKLYTDADKVVIFDHTLRDSSAQPGLTNFREAVRRVHNDQTPDSAARRVAKHLPPEEAEQRLKQRFAIINFWRPIGGRVLQTPLALCDARTMETQDFIASDLVYREWTGETYSVAFNPRHRWYWYPEQSPSEATLIKIYDSAIYMPARWTAHTAFDDPSSPPEAPARHSIEIRALLFWEW